MRYMWITATCLWVAVSLMAIDSNGQITPDTSHFVRRIEVIPNDTLVVNGVDQIRSVSRLSFANGALYSYQWLFNEVQSTQLTVFKSVDTGRTWKTLSSIDASTNISYADWSPNGRYFVTAFEDGSIVCSDDSCKTLRRIPSPTTNPIKRITVDNNGRITLGRVLESTLVSTVDDGITWTSEGLERYAPPYMVAVQFLDYMADGTLYFSFWTVGPDTLSRVLRRMPNGDWSDIGAPFFVESISVAPNGKLLTSTDRRIFTGSDPRRYTEVMSQSSFGGVWGQEFSFIAPVYKASIYDIDFSPYANVATASGAGILLFSVDNRPWTIDYRSKDVYDRVPSNNRIENLIWISPTHLIGTVNRTMFVAEVDFSATSIDERAENVVEKCIYDDASRQIDIYTLDGRRLFSGNEISATEYVVSARGCMMIVSRCASIQSCCKTKFVCQ